MKVFIYTALALIAFAGNSVICRIALGENAIDAASFTSIRLLAGIVMLIIIVKLMKINRTKSASTGWKAPMYLFIYALTFSYAYISLDTGIGALILFGAVQITMILKGVISGTKLHYFEWAGITCAFSGFVYLLSPSLTSPTLLGFILMAMSGIAWGFYTLEGKKAGNPIANTANNFIRTLPMIIILVLFTIQQAELSQHGIFLAILSGALTSAIGYALWYIALEALSSIQAGVLQLLVPVIAAMGGVVFSQEYISMHLFISSIIILSGILIVILGKYSAMIFKRKSG